MFLPCLPDNSHHFRLAIFFRTLDSPSANQRSWRWLADSWPTFNQWLLYRFRLMPGFHHSVAVSPLHKFHKNSVSAVRITLPTWKIPLCRCRFQLPLRRNCPSIAIGSNPIFGRSAVGGQPISVLVTSSLYVYGKTFPASPFSRATATVATERKNGNGTHNGTATAERQRNGGNWKPGTTARAAANE